MSLAILLPLCSFYIAATFFLGTYLKKLSKISLRSGHWLLGFGLILQFGHLVTWFSAKDHIIPSNPLETYLAMTALLALLSWAVSLRRGLIVVPVVLLPMLVVVHICFAFYSPAEAQADLPSLWLWTHILLMILGEVFFFLGAAVSLVYLLADKSLRHQAGASIFARISSLPALESLSRRAAHSWICPFKLGHGDGYCIRIRILARELVFGFLRLFFAF